MPGHRIFPVLIQRSFASFPIVFGQHYGFTLSQEGIAFVAIAIGGILGCIIYVSYQYLHVVPYTLRNGRTHEKRLESALIASFVLTAALFAYGWTAESKPFCMYTIEFAEC